MSDKYLLSHKKNVNNYSFKSISKAHSEYSEQNINLKHNKSSIANNFADLKNGNYVESNKTDDIKLRPVKYGNQNASSTASKINSNSKISDE